MLILTTNVDPKKKKKMKSQLLQTCDNILQNSVITRIPHIGSIY